MSQSGPTLGIYYEHPDWYRPLFDELDRRGVPYDELHADEHRYDPAETHVAVRDRVQPHEPVRLHARPRRRDLLHVAIPRAPRSPRCPRDQRLGRVADGDLEGVPDHAARASRRSRIRRRA